MKCSHCGCDPDQVGWVKMVMGDGVKRVQDCEQENRIKARKSVTAMVDIPSGTTIDVTMVRNLRPCPEGALEPRMLVSVLGQRAVRDIEEGESLFPDMVTRAED